LPLAVLLPQEVETRGAEVGNLRTPLLFAAVHAKARCQATAALQLLLLKVIPRTSHLQGQPASPKSKGKKK
jgi:hypothetical protein